MRVLPTEDGFGEPPHAPGCSDLGLWSTQSQLPRISQLPKLHHTPSLSLSWQQAAPGLNEGQQGSAPALPLLTLKPPILAWLDSNLEETMTNISNILVNRLVKTQTFRHTKVITVSDLQAAFSQECPPSHPLLFPGCSPPGPFYLPSGSTQRRATRRQEQHGPGLVLPLVEWGESRAL